MSWYKISEGFTRVGVFLRWKNAQRRWGWILMNDLPSENFSNTIRHTTHLLTPQSLSSSSSHQHRQTMQIFRNRKKYLSWAWYSVLNSNFEVVQGAQVKFTECSTSLNTMLNLNNVCSAWKKFVQTRDGIFVMGFEEKKKRGDTLGEERFREICRRRTIGISSSTTTAHHHRPPSPSPSLFLRIRSPHRWSNLWSSNNILELRNQV